MATKTKAFQTKYLGARAETKIIMEAGDYGVREIRIRWIDKAVGQPIEWEAGTITSRTVKGNGMRGTLKVLVETHVVEVF